MKYIKITVKSARLVTSKNPEKHVQINNKEKGFEYKKCDDSIIIYGKDNPLDFDKILKLHPIINMLHCFFGYRPVSKTRYSCYKTISRLEKIAENGFFKPFFDVEHIPIEFMQGKPDILDGHRNETPTYIDWNYFKLFLRRKYKNASKGKKFSTIPFDELFELISNKIAQLAGYNSYDDVSIIAALETIGANNELVQQFNNIFSELEITCINSLNLIMSKNKSNFNNYNFGSALLNNIKVLNVISINGSFYFPVSDEDIKQLSKGKLCCTYLDGGLAEIELDEYNNIKTFNNINENYFKATNCVTLKTLRK